MKIATLKHVLSAVPLLAVLGTADIASAHTQDGSLGAAATAIDYYQVTCATGATKLLAHVKDKTADTIALSVQVQKGLLAGNSTDPTGGDAVYSPYITINGKTGVYTVLVDKIRANLQNYTLEAHCHNASNIEVGTTIAVKVNQ